MGVLVKVVWNDAQDHPQKWVDEKDAEAFGEVECQIISYGLLVSDTPKYVTLAADFDAVDRDYGRVTKIPKGMVVTVTPITEGE